MKVMRCLSRHLSSSRQQSDPRLKVRREVDEEEQMSDFLESNTFIVCFLFLLFLVSRLDSIELASSVGQAFRQNREEKVTSASIV